MDFKKYLQNRHVLVPEARKLSDVSISQYMNRLSSLKFKGIYNGEPMITEEINTRINSKYANKTGEYQRTINYYLDSKRY